MLNHDTMSTQYDKVYYVSLRILILRKRQQDDKAKSIFTGDDLGAVVVWCEFCGGLAAMARTQPRREVAGHRPAESLA